MVQITRISGFIDRDWVPIESQNIRIVCVPVLGPWSGSGTLQEEPRSTSLLPYS